MSKGKQIRSQIGSVENTRKITDAMEKVAASKMRAAQQRMTASRPYAQSIRRVINHVAKSHSEYTHPYMMVREPVKRVGLIVISSDRGLCGSLNAGLYRKVVRNLYDWEKAGIPCDLCAVGRKGVGFFTRTKGNLLGKVDQLGDKPKIEDLIGVVKVMLDAFDEGKIDALWLGYNKFVSKMVQQPLMEPLLPLPMIEDDQETSVGHWDYIYEPEARDLLSALLVRYIEMQVYQSVVENTACEQAARMLAMKNATDNAKNIIQELKLAYNKARQAAITQEISEIVAGADAV